MNLVHLQVRNPKDDETPIESAAQIFSSAHPGKIGLFSSIFFTKTYPAYEIYLLSQTIYFYITVPSLKETFISSLLLSSYPNAKIVKTKDPFDLVIQAPYVAVGEMVQTAPYYLPLKTYQDFRDVDPLSPVLGYLAKSNPQFKAAIQIITSSTTFSWQKSATHLAQTSIKDTVASTDPERPRFIPNPEKFIITKKTAYSGGKTLIRLIASGPDKDATLAYLSNLAGTFGAFGLGEGNSLRFSRPSWFKKAFFERVKNRTSFYFDHASQVLNAAEIATLWHPPGLALAGIRNISWGKTLSGEPPENLLVSESVSDDEKKNINFFAKCEFKNKEQIFGIATPDRRKHIYIIGKTGTGKSTLIANMAIDDIRRDRGIGIIDPHGDLCDIILNYIPKRRMNDVVYLEPFDLDRPFHINMLEVKNKEQKDLVASGIVSIFYKLYGRSWGPRLEYILRNIILTLLDVPDTTLADGLKLMVNKEYRKQIVSTLDDQVLKSFWIDEFEKMPDKLRAESVSPIQNKLGQFVTSRMIRNIIGHSRSTIDFTSIMNEGKILLLNLAQGKLGEDNASLLGAMFITRIQLAAMERAYQSEESRRDFFLYVDEFQNFATTSFTKILSEARKYRLSLTIANQYIDQIELPVSKAIFGNVGTLISFVVGSSDGYMLSKEFGAIYTDKDLVSLGKYEIVTKLSVDGMTSSPFPARTLPLPTIKNENKEKIIKLSKEKFGRIIK